MSATPAVAPYVAVRGLCGLTWAATLRGWMVELADGDSLMLVAGAIGGPVIAMLGGFAVSGRGVRWGRILACLAFTAGFLFWLTLATDVGGHSFALDTPHGLWVSVLYESLLVSFALAASVPHRATERRAAPQTPRSSPSTHHCDPMTTRAQGGKDVIMSTVARRWWLLLTVVVVSAAISCGTASAATPVHVKQSVVAPPVDLPAGAVCDFAYHQESSYTQNLTRFFDSTGNLVRVEDQVDLTVLHRNLDTGYTLIEEDHYAAYVDFGSGVATTSGQSWALRAANGRLVLSGAGLLNIDLATGALLTQTPNVKDNRQIFCSALGGAAAP